MKIRSFCQGQIPVNLCSRKAAYQVLVQSDIFGRGRYKSKHQEHVRDRMDCCPAEYSTSASELHSLDLDIMTCEIKVFHDQDIDDLSVIESDIARGRERRSSYPHIFQIQIVGHRPIICVLSPRL